MSLLPPGIQITAPIRATEPIITTTTAFTPTSLTNCRLWIDAADSSSVTRSGTNITGIADKSGSGFNLSNANGFTLSSNFNGSYPSFFSDTQANGNLLGSNISFTISGAVTMFAVGSNTSTSFGGYICDGANGANRVAILDGGFLYTSAAGAYMTGTNNRPIVGRNFVGTWQINGSSSFININGATNTTGSLPTGTFGGIIVGNRFTPDAGNQYIGNLCEFLIYDSVLTVNQYQQVEGYLAWKWGLQASLPGGHPFRNVNPNTVISGALVPRGFTISNPIVMSQTSAAIPLGISILAPIRGQELSRVQTFIFNYTGILQSLSIPSNITQITVYMWGAGGGGAYIDNTGWTPGNGGAGAMIQGTYSVTPNSVLSIIVGRAGAFASSPNQVDAQGGGGLGYFDPPTLWGGGGGGGRSAIQLSAGGADVIVAGGGGGGGVVSSGTRPGGSATFSGTANSGTVATGGSQIAGGTAGSSGVAGSLKFGGAGWNVGGGGFGGGGGGGGYYGGGGGGQGGGGYGSGGGGSSFTGNLSAIGGQSLGFNSSDGTSAPNTGSSFYQAGVAVGGTASRIGGTQGLINLGGNGLVVIVY